MFKKVFQPSYKKPARNENEEENNINAGDIVKIGMMFDTKALGTVEQILEIKESIKKDEKGTIIYKINIEDRNRTIHKRYEDIIEVYKRK